uniref:TIR domain-containing protein n=1 Tax=Chromera velia CCMP2878 TaxID=1169474 RepID=A0A0G4HWR9_9ALVE|eukprot:Cvel_9111.t1-p1 / transcript=Cvel_9111.t1 / gene=Cvel_9111 / organism=Chromera_velia_CCMP2878 / gene_product=hypothetical protein / transcript_product=hypothetical protein / location=Cvel_scaffold517:47062-49911(+) / protein_length=344 / sequence_SO=supercontig / SO=protein_coding / is_pseudo=false
MPPPGKNNDFFLGHTKRSTRTSTEDFVAQTIYPILSSRGHKCFYDRHSLAGQDIETCLSEAKLSVVHIVVLDDCTMQSNYVIKELEASVESSNPIVTVYRKDVFSWTEVGKPAWESALGPERKPFLKKVFSIPTVEFEASARYLDTSKDILTQDLEKVLDARLQALSSSASGNAPSKGTAPPVEQVDTCCGCGTSPTPLDTKAVYSLLDTLTHSPANSNWATIIKGAFWRKQPDPPIVVGGCVRATEAGDGLVVIQTRLIQPIFPQISEAGQVDANDVKKALGALDLERGDALIREEIYTTFANLYMKLNVLSNFQRLQDRNLDPGPSFKELSSKVAFFSQVAT